MYFPVYYFNHFVQFMPNKFELTFHNLLFSWIFEVYIELGLSVWIVLFSDVIETGLHNIGLIGSV